MEGMGVAKPGQCAVVSSGWGARLCVLAVMHLLDPDSCLWSQQLLQFNSSNAYDVTAFYDPVRRVGRPHLRWDDHIQQFCEFMFPAHAGRH